MKLLANNKAMVMIEMIIVLLFLSFTILINIHLFNTSNKNNVYLNEISLLEININNAKNKAILKRNNAYLSFNSNKLVISDNYSNDEYVFKTINFETNYSLYFNARGVVNQGKTINFKYSYMNKKIIFYIGKGWFKIE